MQHKEDVPSEHLEHIGNYIVEKKPDVVICLGDFADMPSLSSYDVGKKNFEGRRYRSDIEAAQEGMHLLLQPIWDFNARARKNKEKQYNPRKILTLGNHEDRITRAINGDPKLDGTIGLSDLKYEEYGWEVYPYLDVVMVNGIAYSHYFTSGVLGRPVTSASALLGKKHQSCVMGHVQDRQIAYGRRADGKQLLGLFAGSSYLHNEDYLGEQGNNYWRGIWMLHEVNDGACDEMAVSLSYLKRRYG